VSSTAEVLRECAENQAIEDRPELEGILAENDNSKLVSQIAETEQCQAGLADTLESVNEQQERVDALQSETDALATDPSAQPPTTSNGDDLNDALRQESAGLDGCADKLSQQADNIDDLQADIYDDAVSTGAAADDTAASTSDVDSSASLAQSDDTSSPTPSLPSGDASGSGSTIDDDVEDGTNKANDATKEVKSDLSDASDRIDGLKEDVSSAKEEAARPAEEPKAEPAPEADTAPTPSPSK